MQKYDLPSISTNLIQDLEFRLYESIPLDVEFRGFYRFFEFIRLILDTVSDSEKELTEKFLDNGKT